MDSLQQRLLQLAVPEFVENIALKHLSYIVSYRFIQLRHATTRYCNPLVAKIQFTPTERR